MSVKRFRNGGMKIGSFIDMLNNWVYHGWEDHTGVIMINIYLPLIALANTLPIRAKDGNTYAFGVASLFKMHPPSKHVDLVASLCTSGSGGTTWMQTYPYPLVLKPVSVS